MEYNSQESELNPELFEMVRSGKLSAEKIIALIEIKHTVDRFACSKYTAEKTMEDLKNRFGVYPDIITWGDYFQTEIGSMYFDKTDEEFRKIADTIHFDLISSHLIFSGKPDYFRDKVRGDALFSKSFNSDLLSGQDEENIHLEILLDYFENMNLDKKPLSLSDRRWYEGFGSQKLAM
ncbi:MAG: hypothetical protein K8R21_06915 [Leptospira sp.]|nr:hypothetical protein [Leptospira sp.]